LVEIRADEYLRHARDCNWRGAPLTQRLDFGGEMA
jgi:hypothetical protein